jgi:2,4-dienoyl-CoA reductase (NADPH2)
MPFAHLAQPIVVGPLSLPNRVIMGSMHTGLEGHEQGFEQLARFYAERARGGTALIVTGGFSPNRAGRMKDEPSTLESMQQANLHRRITDAVHAEGGRIVLQILHSGRYGYHPDIVAPSPIRAPINRHVPAELTDEAIRQTIADYVRCTELALYAGYDGVEIMGSEGYLISEFLALRTNQRTDDWGGTLENRARFPVSVVREIRSALGRDFLLMYRHSVLDLVDGGLSWDETVWVATQVARAGADVISTGIGWHEATIPTIAGTVPRAAFADAIKRLKASLDVPVVASNRINLPETADTLIASGVADLVSMARPMLADPAFVRKALGGRPDAITVCIACNQACLDHYFESRVISCLLNPRAAHEADFELPAPVQAKRVAVVGAGVAGLACAIEARRRGHEVVVFEANPAVGGQFRLAAQVPGKEDYALAVQAYARQLAEAGVPLRLGHPVTAAELEAEGFDDIVIATGVRPRPLDIPGADDPRVVDYAAALSGTAPVGDRVAVIGGGGIGHDVALFLAHGHHGETTNPAAFFQRWGVEGAAPVPTTPQRQVTLLKRSPGPFGRGLGKSTGWILRQELRDLEVQQIAGVTYRYIDHEGLHITVENENRCIPADTIVVCAGQLSERTLADELLGAGRKVHIIGGAKLAAELDAKRAIHEGATLGAAI